MFCLQNIVLRRAQVVLSDTGVVGSYVHNFGSYGAIVEVKTKDGTPLDSSKYEQAREFCSKVAQHIVAQDPGKIGEDGMKKLNKQQFVFDPSMNISQYLVKTSKQLGIGLSITNYLRWKCGADA